MNGQITSSRDYLAKIVEFFLKIADLERDNQIKLNLEAKVEECDKDVN